MKNIKEATLDYWEYLSSPDTVTGLYITWIFAGLILLLMNIL